MLSIQSTGLTRRRLYLLKIEHGAAEVEYERGRDMDLPAGVSSHDARTGRLKIRYIESGPKDGIPLLMIHGNLSTGRFYEHLMPGAPDGYRIIAPDMRAFGATAPVPIDATRGLRAWADDAFALIQTLAVIDPVSAYGFGGVRLDGTPCFPDYAGSGGGTGNPEFIKRIAEHDTSSDSPFSPRNVMNSSYWAASHREPKEREDILVEEILRSVTGDDGNPGDSTASADWPGAAPATRGILNGLSCQHCNCADSCAIDP